MDLNIKISVKGRYVLNLGCEIAAGRRNEYYTPEHLLMGILAVSPYDAIADKESVDKARALLTDYVNELDKCPEEAEAESIELSNQMTEVLTRAHEIAHTAGKDEIEPTHLVAAMYVLEESYACSVLEHCFGPFAQMMAKLAMIDFMTSNKEGDREASVTDENVVPHCMKPLIDDDDTEPMVVGRAGEIERALQIMCRIRRHHVLLVGDDGVGRKAVARGIAERIAAGQGPMKFGFGRMFTLDCELIASSGRQMPGAAERKVQDMVASIPKEWNDCIVLIEDIHRWVGSASGAEGEDNIVGMLLGAFGKRGVRIVGTTTFEEMTKRMAKNKHMMRHFNQIDIEEMGRSEALEVMMRGKEEYEQKHNVRFSNEMLEYILDTSIEHMPAKVLPQKALDLMDDVGAALEVKRGRRTTCAAKRVTKSNVDTVLTTVCQVKGDVLKQGNKALATLGKRMKEQIYGQDEAIDRLVESIQMSKAGLLDAEKPLASMLFVGPTGVGKTEVARVLAHEMGVELVRFDMSEYVEKHTVAKLIGSPAGYVGYDDGGLLTKAIGKSPNCVLLLDEIEKAHEDIYNILLQIMDYGKLTDNKGEKADFRNTVVIMTSNAGAQFAKQASVGFAGGVSEGEAMLAQVKKTFKPEFLGRLSATLVFRAMDQHMAELILDKKMAQLAQKLAKKNVSIQLSTEARQFIMERGFTAKNGGREIDHALQQLLMPLLTQEILFGSLQKGGKAEVEVESEKLKLKNLD